MKITFLLLNLILSSIALAGSIEVCKGYDKQRVEEFKASEVLSSLRLENAHGEEVGVYIDHGDENGTLYLCGPGYNMLYVDMSFSNLVANNEYEYEQLENCSIWQDEAETQACVYKEEGRAKVMLHIIDLAGDMEMNEGSEAKTFFFDIPKKWQK